MVEENRTATGGPSTTSDAHKTVSPIRVHSWSFVADRLSLPRPTLLALPLLAAIGLLSACSKEEPKPVVPPAPVSVSEVVQKSVPVQVRAIGNVQPITTVQIKAHVSGEVSQVNFQEGQDVKKGAPLFVIDPRTFEAAVKQAEATLARDTAVAQQARANMAKDSAQAKNAQVWSDH